MSTGNKHESGTAEGARRATFQGYRDIVLGSHRSYGITGLEYFRFDGKAYRSIATATLNSDDDGVR